MGALGRFWYERPAGPLQLASNNLLPRISSFFTFQSREDWGERERCSEMPEMLGAKANTRDVCVVWGQRKNHPMQEPSQAGETLPLATQNMFRPNVDATPQRGSRGFWVRKEARKGQIWVTSTWEHTPSPPHTHAYTHTQTFMSKDGNLVYIASISNLIVQCYYLVVDI